jgi:hypothetical protein
MFVKGSCEKILIVLARTPFIPVGAGAVPRV